jgi:hypothetical protein
MNFNCAKPSEGIGVHRIDWEELARFGRRRARHVISSPIDFVGEDGKERCKDVVETGW